MSVTPLLRLKEPKATENLIAYLLRLTEINDYDKLRWIFEITDLPKDLQNTVAHFFDRGQDLSKLSQLTCLEEAKLRSLQYPLFETSFGARSSLFFDFQVHANMLSIRFPKICPICISDLGYIHRAWDLVIVTACPLHRCLLLDTCPKCRKRIRWSRNSLSICACGCDWRKVEQLPAKNNDLKVVRHIYKLCGIIENKKNEPHAYLSNPLNSLDLSSFLTALFFVAGQFKGVTGTTGHRVSYTTPYSELHGLLIKAWDVFDNWPNNFFQFISWQREARGKSSQSGIAAQFGTFNRVLSRFLSSDCFDFMREAFNIYLRDTWDGRYLPGMHAQVLGERLKKKYVIESTAAEYLGINATQLSKLVSSKKLEAIERRSKGKRILLIEQTSLHEYKNKLENSLSTTDLMETLGVSYPAVVDLIEQRCLVPFSGPTIDGMMMWKIHRNEVTRLTDEIAARVAPPARRQSDGIMRFAEAMIKIGRLGVGTGAFVNAILEKKIIPFELSKKGKGFFVRLRFLKEQVLEYVKQQMQRKKGEALYLEAAASELGVGPRDSLLS